MWFFVLWSSLGVILVVHAILRREWITGQTAFTGIWFASLTALCCFPPAWEFISEKAALLIILTHLSFFFGSIGASSLYKGRPLSLDFAPSVRTKKTLECVSILLIFIGTIGSWLAVHSSGAFHAFQQGKLDIMHSMLTSQVIEIPVIVRLMSNFVYPAALLGALCFISSKRSLLSWFYILFPLAGSILYGFAFGGRGAVIMVVPMILWVLAIGGKERLGTWADRLLLISAMVAVLLFVGMIVETRKDLTTPAESIFRYFAGPIPALSEWLSIKPIVLFNIDFSNIAIVREIMRLFGPYSERAIGFDIVFVPFPFNVFTYLAEQIRDFGIIGALLVSALLGTVSSLLEHKKQTVSVLGLRAAIYAYLSYSLFADMAFFIVGWWLCIFILIFIFPLFKLLSFLFPKKSITGLVKELGIH